MVNIPASSGSFGVGNIPSQALFDDPALMRRYRLAEIMSQSALGGAPPRTALEAFSRAIQAGVGSHIAGEADRSIAERRKTYNATLAGAIAAGQPQVSGDDFTFTSDGTQVPRGQMVPGSGGLQNTIDALKANPDTAPLAMQTSLGLLTQKEAARQKLADSLAEQKALNPILAERTGMTGAAEIPNAVAKQAAMLPGSIAEQQALNPVLAQRAGGVAGATAAAEMPFVGPKAEAAATGTTKGQFSGFMGAPSPIQPPAVPGAQAIPPQQTGEAAPQGNVNQEFLASLNPAIGGTVKGIAEGRIPVSPQMVRTPQGMALLDAVNKYDPSFDAVNYQARSKTRNAFTSGSEAKMLNATNTVMGHMDEFEKAATALDNSDYPAINKVRNMVGSEVSPDLKAKLNRFDLTKQAVVSELERAYRGSGGSQADIEAWKKTLNSADSPEAMRASMQQGTRLLSSKIEALGEQYNKGMGTTKRPFELLSPKAAKTYQRLLGEGGDNSSERADPLGIR